MKKVLFAINSSISRPSGIMTFVQNTADILRQAGHRVDGISDGPALYDMSKCFDNFYYDKTPRNYKNIGTQVMPIPEMSTRIRNTYDTISDYDIIISNDCQSTDALSYTNNVIHYVHIGAIVDSKCQQNTLSKEYLDNELRAMKSAKAVGVPSQITADLIGKDFKFKVLGLPLYDYTPFLPKSTDDKTGVLFIGQGSKQKGADTFIDVLRHIDTDTKIIADNFIDVEFNTKTYKFSPEQVIQKAEFIRSAKCMYLPSRSETFSYSCMEALLSLPVYVDPQYTWTKNIVALGAIPIKTADAVNAISSCLALNNNHDNSLVIDYLDNAKQQWINYCK